MYGLTTGSFKSINKMGWFEYIKNHEKEEKRKSQILENQVVGIRGPTWARTRDQLIMSQLL